MAVSSEPIVLDALERPMRDLRISVIDKCNMRCTYCMPKETFGEDYVFLPRAELLTFEEITRLAGLFAGLGVQKFRLTGGEPLLRRELPKLVAMLAQLGGGADIALTTNGLLFAKFARPLRDAGLRRVTFSLDSLDPEVFRQMGGEVGAPEDVLRGIDAAVSEGFKSIKVNVVVQRGVNDEGVLAMVERFRGTGVTLRFIEYMDVGNRNGWRMDHVVASAELAETINSKWPIRPVDRGYRGEVAERYEFVDGAGELGFISSVSQPFCGDCTRSRLSADGRLYTCLFAASGVNLRGPLRAGDSDSELRERIAKVWRARDDRYSELRTSMTETDRAHRKVEMYQIGG